MEVVLTRGDQFVVAAGFGPGSDWYRNLSKNPSTVIQVGRRRIAVTAERVNRSDRESAMAEYANAHPRAAASLARFMGFEIDGSEADYRRVGAALHMLRFVPSDPVPHADWRM